MILRHICTFCLILCQVLRSQGCLEEESEESLNVKWQENITTHNCNKWSLLNHLDPCLQSVKKLDLTSCPPGFYEFSDNNKHCYKILPPSPWNSPCFKSGATVITDFSEKEINSLLNSLKTLNISRYFWLPAHRQRVFNPVVWSIAGPRWGHLLESNNVLRLKTSIIKNCLLIDIQQKLLVTEMCNKVYPSLCFYINDILYPAKCPNGYYAFRFQPEDDKCYGVEKSHTDSNLTFNDFLKTKCSTPMGYEKYNSDIIRYIYQKVTALNNFSDSVYCWFTALYEKHENMQFNITEKQLSDFQGTINSTGMLSLRNISENLSCMACETNTLPPYRTTELTFEYNPVKGNFYLTVYHPSGLWKYNSQDTGMQCFSNAKGFVSIVDINELPYIEVTRSFITNSTDIEKVVYEVNLITERPAQYWCEGHTSNFTHITTEKLIVNPQGYELHVFSLVLKICNLDNDEMDITNFTDVASNLTNVFNAQKVLLMDILEYTSNHILILLHLHVTVDSVNADVGNNLLETYNFLHNIATYKLLEFNYTFINLSSSLYCLPTTSKDVITLQWEMTPIGHVTAPKQFCLQENGLPVKRQCHGSYLLGGYWGRVEGVCSKNFQPSATTSFLYNFVKGHVPENYTSRFLVEGLHFVLSNIEIIIPADIYYLSISLQQVLNLAHENQSLIYMGDLENMAWAIDKIMNFDEEYLKLSQTLNSTNIILDSTNNIIETLVQRNNMYKEKKLNTYSLAVQPYYVAQVSYPLYNNVTGIAISNSNNFSDKFTETNMQPLYKNTTLDDVLSINNLELAAWIPENVFKTLRKVNDSSNEPINNDDMFVVINVFYNDAVFNELDDRKHVSNSRIIGISMPGFTSNLEYPVPLLFKSLNHTASDKYCGYWDFQTQKSGSSPGFWGKKGCYLVKSLKDITFCECYHLTHFGELFKFVNSRSTKKPDKIHITVLNVITLVGSFMSLVGIAGIWITALTFKVWRKKPGTKILLQLSSAISLPLLLIIVFNLSGSIFIEHEGKYKVAEKMKFVCIALGALLHYSVLASFMWMLITAILQFVRYVIVLGARRPSRFMAKFTLAGWGIPLVPVIIVLALDNENYIPNSNVDYIEGGVCYPKGLYLVIGIVIPICFILFINITLFFMVIYAISRGPDGKIRTADMDLVGAQLRLSIILFFLLGLTWIFGIFSFSSNLIWSYLFCLTSTLQGFVLFIYFIICDPNTRTLWTTLMKPQFRRTSSSKSLSSITSG